jgi:uncharacterized protein YkwD
MRPRTAVRLGVAALALALAPPALADSATFENPETVNASTFLTTSPYPADLAVSGMAGVLTNATATLNMVDRATGVVGDPAKQSLLDVMLVSPAGKTVMLFSDVTGNSAQADMTFSDSASVPVPEGAIGLPGTYTATDNDPLGNNDAFDAPAPSEPYGATMAALNGDSPNGTWKLFVYLNGELPDPQSAQIHGWKLTLTSALPPQPPAQDPPVQLPPPEPPKPQPEPTTPKVEAAAFAKDPVVGQTADFRVTASDPNSAVTGIVVDFGEKLGLWAESACVQGSGSGGEVVFNVPYRYLTPGPHTITITVISGGCGMAEATQHTTTVTVNAAKGARASATTLPTPPTAGTCAGANLTPTVANAKLIEEALLCLMNLQRAKKHLKALKTSPRLRRAAMAHSSAMVTGKFFAHQGPREAHLTARLKRVKYVGKAGENIGAGAGPYGTPAAMVRGWLKSPPHKKNLFYPSWRAVGIAFIPKFPLRTGDRPVATYTTDFAPKP